MASAQHVRQGDYLRVKMGEAKMPKTVRVASVSEGSIVAWWHGRTNSRGYFRTKPRALKASEEIIGLATAEEIAGFEWIDEAIPGR